VRTHNGLNCVTYTLQFTLYQHQYPRTNFMYGIYTYMYILFFIRYARACDTNRNFADDRTGPGLEETCGIDSRAEPVKRHSRYFTVIAFASHSSALLYCWREKCREYCSRHQDSFSAGRSRESLRGISTRLIVKTANLLFFFLIKPHNCRGCFREPEN